MVANEYWSSFKNNRPLANQVTIHYWIFHLVAFEMVGHARHQCDLNMEPAESIEDVAV